MKKNKSPEQKLRNQVSQYLQIQYPNIIFHFDIGSDGRKGIGKAVRDSKLNPWHGFPDLFIVEPVSSFDYSNGHDVVYYGLFIELKSEGTQLYKRDGTLRKNEHIERQSEMLKMLENRGYKAVFGIGFDECKKIIDDYLRS